MKTSGTWTASRRNVLQGVGMTALGSTVSFGPALAQGTPAAAPPAAAPPAAPKGPKLLDMQGKAKLAVLGDKPLVAETPVASARRSR